MTNPKVETNQAPGMTGSGKPGWIVPPRTPVLTWSVTLLAGLVVGASLGALAQSGYEMETFLFNGIAVATVGFPPVGAIAGGVGGVFAAIFWCRATLHLVRKGRSPLGAGAKMGCLVGIPAGVVPHLPLSYMFGPQPIVLVVGGVFGLVAGAVAGLVCGLVLWMQLPEGVKSQPPAESRP